MCSLLQLPADILRDIIGCYLCEVSDIVHLEMSVISTKEKVSLWRCIADSKHFNTIAFHNGSRELIKWLCKVGVMAADVTFARGFSFEGSSLIVKVVSTAKIISCQACEFPSNNAFKSVLESACTHLRSLFIANCDLTCLGGLSACSQLTSMHLFQCNYLSDETFIEAVTGLKKLKVCLLSRCRKLTTTSVCAALTFCKELESMNITNMAEDIRLEKALSVLAEPCLLKTLIADGCIVTDLTMQIVAATMPHLQILHLNTRNTSVRDTDIDLVARNCPGITSLEMTYFKSIGNALLIGIATHLKKLVNLRLVVHSRSNISDAGIVALGEGLPSLTTLCIAGSERITDHSIRVVGARCFRLCHLSLQCCRNLTDRAFDTIASTQLTSLDVSGTQVSGSFNDNLLRVKDSDLCCDWCSMLTDALVDFVLSRPHLLRVSLVGSSLPRASWIRFAEQAATANIKSVDITHVNKEVVQMFKQLAPPSMAVIATR